MSTVRIEHRSGKDDWCTPDSVFSPLNEEFGFTLDAAAEPNNALCYTYCSEHGTFRQGGDWRLGHGMISPKDGLTYDWSKHMVWCNPPYSQWQKWVAKAAQEAALGATVVMLLPARTDTIAFHKYIWPFADVEIRFIKGRVRFVGADHGAPFPSMIVVFWPRCQPIARPEPIEDSFWTAPPLLTYTPKSGIVHS